jgi:L-histidine Nalpha-methyltransferase
VAFFNPAESRVEIYIESLVAQLVHIAGRGFRLNAGERIHTEYSYKYTIDGFRALARSAGWTPVETWTDSNNLFSVHYLRRS